MHRMKTMTDDKEKIRQFLLEKLAKAKKIKQIDDQDNLIETGIIDSLGIMQLVAYLEGMFTVKVKDEDIVPENFESIDIITSYIERLR
jgi:acyl carrier protein